MIIKLLPSQIPLFWESIKYGTTKADEVDEKDLQPYLTDMLIDLLSEKAQCWVRLDEDRTLSAIMITQIKGNAMGKELYIKNLFAYKKVDDEVWQKEYDLVKEFMRQEKCDSITFESRNPRIWDIGKTIGFTEQTRRFIYKEA